MTLSCSRAILVPMEERKKLVREADKVAALYVKKRDGRCLVCGASTDLTCGHLFSRAHYSTRWIEENLYTQCKGCNLLHEHDPYPLLQVAIRKYGKKKIDTLHRKFQTPVKTTNGHLKLIIEHYKKKLSALEGG